MNVEITPDLLLLMVKNGARHFRVTNGAPADATVVSVRINKHGNAVLTYTTDDPEEYITPQITHIKTFDDLTGAAE